MKQLNHISVRASVQASVWDYAGASVWRSVRRTVQASVWTSVRDSVWASVLENLRRTAK